MAHVIVACSGGGWRAQLHDAAAGVRGMGIRCARHKLLPLTDSLICTTAAGAALQGGERDRAAAQDLPASWHAHYGGVAGHFTAAALPQQLPAVGPPGVGPGGHAGVHEEQHLVVAACTRACTAQGALASAPTTPTSTQCSPNPVALSPATPLAQPPLFTPLAH